MTNRHSLGLNLKTNLFIRWRAKWLSKVLETFTINQQLPWSFQITNEVPIFMILFTPISCICLAQIGKSAFWAFGISKQFVISCLFSMSSKFGEENMLTCRTTGWNSLDEKQIDLQCIEIMFPIRLLGSAPAKQQMSVDLYDADGAYEVWGVHWAVSLMPLTYYCHLGLSLLSLFPSPSHFKAIIQTITNRTQYFLQIFVTFLEIKLKKGILNSVSLQEEGKASHCADSMQSI